MKMRELFEIDNKTNSIEYRRTNEKHDPQQKGATKKKLLNTLFILRSRVDNFCFASRTQATIL